MELFHSSPQRGHIRPKIMEDQIMAMIIIFYYYLLFNLKSIIYKVRLQCKLFLANAVLGLSEEEHPHPSLKILCFPPAVTTWWSLHSEDLYTNIEAIFNNNNIASGWIRQVWRAGVKSRLCGSWSQGIKKVGEQSIQMIRYAFVW